MTFKPVAAAAFAAIFGQFLQFIDAGMRWGVLQALTAVGRKRLAAAEVYEAAEQQGRGEESMLAMKVMHDEFLR
ncbi:hypothetical protein PSEUDO8BK_30267 [Pseudomonas sp. 8BK]|nr:hypothetical protein PSEUDO8BK_30267 [Pseudomonas sp. 8BK]